MIEYEFTNQDFKKYLVHKRFTTNLVFLIFGSLLYFYYIFYIIVSNPFEAFIYYFLYLIIMLILIVLFNKIYCYINIRKNNIFGKYKVDIKKDKIIVNIDNNNHEYLNKDIKIIIVKKRYIQIKYSNHLSLLFIKELINDKDYNKILNSVKKM